MYITLNKKYLHDFRFVCTTSCKSGESQCSLSVSTGCIMGHQSSQINKQMPVCRIERMRLIGQDTHPALVSVSDSLSLGLPLPICREPWPAREGGWGVLTRTAVVQLRAYEAPCVDPNTFQIMLLV